MTTIKSVGNREQRATLTTLLDRFGCERDDFQVLSAWDLPEGYVSVVIGQRKGYPIALGISKEGRASS